MSSRRRPGEPRSGPVPRVPADPVDELEPVPDAELLVDVVDVVPDRARGDEELPLDVLVAGPLEDQAEDLLFPRGQLVGFDDAVQVLADGPEERT